MLLIENDFILEVIAKDRFRGFLLLKRIFVRDILNFSFMTFLFFILSFLFFCFINFDVHVIYGVFPLTEGSSQ